MQRPMEKSEDRYDRRCFGGCLHLLGVVGEWRRAHFGQCPGERQRLAPCTADGAVGTANHGPCRNTSLGLIRQRRDQTPPRRPPTVEGDSGVHGGPTDRPTREGAANLVAKKPGERALAPARRLSSARPGVAVRGSISGRPDSARHSGAGDSTARSEIANT